MGAHQLAMFQPSPEDVGRRFERGLRAYVVQGQERPADLPRLQATAATMEARVLDWYADRFGVRGYMAQTPTMCAEALGLPLTTVRPRVCQLSKRVHGPRIEACRWLARRPTAQGSEGWYRFTEADPNRTLVAIESDHGGGANPTPQSSPFRPLGGHNG